MLVARGASFEDRWPHMHAALPINVLCKSNVRVGYKHWVTPHGLHVTEGADIQADNLSSIFQSIYEWPIQNTSLTPNSGT